MWQVAGFAVLYSLVMLATLPFLVYFGQPKPWQKVVEFLLSFPLDNEKLGLFSFAGAAVIVFLNGLLWGVVFVSVSRLIQMIIGLIIK